MAVDQGRLARLHLPDHRDRRFGVFQLVVQLSRGPVGRLVANLAKAHQRLAQAPSTSG